MDKILRALDDYYEAKEELKQMQAEYTGYSPSYALQSWYSAEEKAKERLAAALDAYIDERVKRRTQPSVLGGPG
jgi:hypothetical protein